jgi:hypothetical protein
MTDAERASEIRRAVFAERFGVEPGGKNAPTTTEAECRTEELRKIHSEARRRLSAGRRLAAWPVAERAAYFPERAQTASVFLPERTGITTVSARCAEHGP